MIASRPIGKTRFQISAIGLGCWQFSEGKGLIGGYWPALDQHNVNEIVAASIAGGVTWFDTAEAYGEGRSERALARALQASGKKPGEVLVATKWNPAFRTAKSIGTTIAERLSALAPYPIALYQIHQPLSFSTIDAEMRAMAQLLNKNQIGAVGVSNFNAKRMRRAHEALAAQGVVLASNQVKYSLSDRRIERNGILAQARELGITIIAYSPLDQGLLSGKFHAGSASQRSPLGLRRFFPQFRKSNLRRTQPLIDALHQIASKHGVTSSQIALNWLIHFHGETVVAIPGASTTKQARENARAMEFQLSRGELEHLDAVSLACGA